MYFFPDTGDIIYTRGTDSYCSSLLGGPAAKAAIISAPYMGQPTRGLTGYNQLSFDFSLKYLFLFDSSEETYRLSGNAKYKACDNTDIHSLFILYHNPIISKHQQKREQARHQGIDNILKDNLFLTDIPYAGNIQLYKTHNHGSDHHHAYDRRALHKLVDDFAALHL